MLLIALLACHPYEPAPKAERPVVVASSTEMDFGWVAEGDVATQELVLRNDGGLPFGIMEYQLLRPENALGTGFSVTGIEPGTVVSAGEEAVATVSFAPGAARCEDALYIWFTEDQETVWIDREHAWLVIPLGGSGAGMPPAAPPVPYLIGGIVPERTGVEVGGTIAMKVRPHEELQYAWNVPYGEDGRFMPSDAESVLWTAPDTLPSRFSELRHVDFQAWNAPGDNAFDSIRVAVYPPGGLREPIVLGSE